MAQNKVKKRYKGISFNVNNPMIQKSKPLQLLSQTDLTLAEFKILDVYLSRINSHDDSIRTVVLEKGELEKILGVTRILKNDLDKRLDNLFQVLTFLDDNNTVIDKIGLFSRVLAKQDDDGLWQITLTCTPEARKYIFNIDNIGYLRYRLKNVVNLTSRYSYILFLYLTDNRYRQKWVVSITQLKTFLNCTAERYNEFKFFNSEILKKVHNELSEKTDLKYSYTPIRKGRKVAEIEFTVDDVFEQEQEQEQIENKENEIDYGSDLLNVMNVVSNNTFTKEELTVLKNYVVSKLDTADLLECTNYFKKQYDLLVYQDSKKHISNKFKYMRKMLENE